jgi:hypothetical protein
MSINAVSSHTSPAASLAAITTLAKASTESQELGSVGGSSSAGDSVASTLSSAFQSLLTSLSANDTSTATASTASSNAIQSFINGALQDLQSGGSSTVGNLVNTTA